MSDIVLKESPARRVDITHDGETVVRTFHGSFSDCVKYARGIDMLKAGTDGSLYTGVSVQRLNAQRGSLEVSSKQFKHLSWWGLTFCEISKPIKVWLAEKLGSDNPSLATELAKVQLWEQLLSVNPAAYARYETGTGEKITDENTLALCKKIRSGVDSYSVYAPVVTCSRTGNQPFVDRLGDIGKYADTIRDVVDTTKWPPANSDLLDAFDGLGVPFWLKQSDSVTQNTDGTFTRSEQFQGLTYIDRDLYTNMKGEGGDTPSDSAPEG